MSERQPSKQGLDHNTNRTWYYLPPPSSHSSCIRTLPRYLDRILFLSKVYIYIYTPRYYIYSTLVIVLINQVALTVTPRSRELTSFLLPFLFYFVLFLFRSVRRRKAKDDTNKASLSTVSDLFCHPRYPAIRLFTKSPGARAPLAISKHY